MANIRLKIAYEKNSMDREMERELYKVTRLINEGAYQNFLKKFAPDDNTPAKIFMYLCLAKVTKKRLAEVESFQETIETIKKLL